MKSTVCISVFLSRKKVEVEQKIKSTSFRTRARGVGSISHSQPSNYSYPGTRIWAMEITWKRVFGYGEIGII